MDGVDVGRLVALALDVTASPGAGGQSGHYRALVERYLTDASFRQFVDDVLEGAACEVVQADRHLGLIIASSSDGPWAWPRRAAELPWSKNFDDRPTRAVRMLVLVAVLAYIAPTAADFDDLLADPLAVSASFTASQLDRFIRDFAEHKEAQSSDPLGQEPPLWWHWLQRPAHAATLTGSRTSPRSTVAVVHDVLSFLHGQHLLAKTSGSNVKDNTYRPRRRLIAQCRTLMVDDLLQQLQAFATDTDPDLGQEEH
jgi:hypothetical protein